MRLDSMTPFSDAYIGDLRPAIEELVSNRGSNETNRSPTWGDPIAKPLLRRFDFLGGSVPHDRTPLEVRLISHVAG